ncbi:MAG: LysM peptidoglycan-binding domain-containing protein [Clostridiales bacterium]|nr:LysM peptidoglycan-binding domain-containing protein [Clostridiales bacterium]
MIIHIVGQGETIYSIASEYGKSADRLALENGITTADNLAIGEAMVILYPKIEYTVQVGDTLGSIARKYNTTIMEILRNNPYLSDREYIYPGELIVIEYEGQKIRAMSVTGYVYPFVNLKVLRKTLPFLTYLSVYSHYYNEKGEILHVDDSKLIQKAIRYGVAPIMVLNEMSASPEEVRGITHTILNNQALQNDLINNLINTLDRSGYYGVDFISPYILPADRPLYVEFIERLSSRLHLEGYKVFLSMTICIFEMVANIVYEDLQLERLGQCVDKVMFISYEGGYAFGISQGLIAYDTSNNRLNYVTGKINPEKTMFGISTIGYDWKLPYIGGVSKGQAISYNSAIELAREFNAEIKFDDVTKFSYFQYATNYDYVVRFKDARGIDAFVGLVPIHGINGVGLWNIMYFMAPMWLVINSQYEIEKVLPIRI